MEAKLKTAAATRALGLPLTLNVVLHRGNIGRAAEFVALAERLGAARLELANTQYLGWALANREALLPSRAAVDAARGVALGRARAAAWQDGDPLRAPRLLRRPPARLHGRLGAPLPGRHPRRRRAAVPPGAGDRAARLGVGERPRALAGRDLERRRRFPRVPRRGLDARALPDLRRADGRLRRLPLPGLRAARRRRRDRSRLRAGAPARVGRRGARARRGGAGRRAADASPNWPLRLRRLRQVS